MKRLAVKALQGASSKDFMVSGELIERISALIERNLRKSQGSRMIR